MKCPYPMSDLIRSKLKCPGCPRALLMLCRRFHRALPGLGCPNHGDLRGLERVGIDWFPEEQAGPLAGVER